MGAKYNYILKYHIKAKCAEPLHIGSSTGDSKDILINPVDNIPFIQASSISGAFGSYVSNSNFSEYKDKLFGSANSTDCNNKSQIVFSDGVFTNVSTEIRPRLKLNGKTGTVATSNHKGTGGEKSGQKLELEYVSAGSIFEFTIHIMCNREDSDNYQNIIEDALSALDKGVILFGGQKTNGCGSIKLLNVYKSKFDLTIANDRVSWLDDRDQSTDIINSIVSIALKESLYERYEIVFKAKADRAVLIKSLAVTEKDSNGKEPDAMNIKNNNKEAVIPGSSFKGVVRSRVEAIGNYLNIDEEKINEVFGRAGNSGDRGIAGTVRFGETIIKNKKERVIPRIKIDKFTGGVAASALFSEMPASGQLETKVVISGKSEVPSKAICGLMILAFRDIAVGAVSIGSGANIGRGFLNASSLSITSQGKSIAEINFQNSSIDNGQKFVDECLKEVKGL